MAALWGFICTSFVVTLISESNFVHQQKEPVTAAIVLTVLVFMVAAILGGYSIAYDINGDDKWSSYTVRDGLVDMFCVIEFPFAVMMLITLLMDCGPGDGKKVQGLEYLSTNPPYSLAIGLIVAVCVTASVGLAELIAAQARKAVSK